MVLLSWRRFFEDMAAVVGKPPPPVIPLADVLAIVRANEDPANLVEPIDRNRCLLTRKSRSRRCDAKSGCGMKPVCEPESKFVALHPAKRPRLH
jgi:hypothetical protein